MEDIQLDTNYLKGIGENNYTILQKIYQESLPDVIKHVQRNSGSLDDAKDVFQEAILIIYNKVHQDSLELTTSFQGYLFSICKKLWLKKLRSKSSKTLPLSFTWDLKVDTEYEENFLKTRKWKLFNDKFQNLAEECRKVLQLLFNGKSGKEIAAEMGYTVEYAKRKKYKCKIGLTELIRKDPEYQVLTRNP